MSSDEVLSNLEIIDISAKQLELFNNYKSFPIQERNNIFLDSIYRPYAKLWKGYLGSEEDFIQWVDETVDVELSQYNKKAKSIDLDKMNDYFAKTAVEMAKFSGYLPKGKWYVFWGPKWTDLGGFGDGTMLIDLANQNNKSLHDITRAFPHEINHQIYSNTNSQNEDYSVLSRIIDEGFACFVSHKFRAGKTSIAYELRYTDQEYEYCLKHEDKILNLIRSNSFSTDREEINKFVSRTSRIEENYPGAIGYFIGLRIIEEYVKNNGENSWKKIYKLSPREVLTKSEILN